MARVQHPLEARRSRLLHSESVQGQVHVITGFVELIGAGEVLVDVNFPIKFTERPCFTFGGEVGPNQALEDGNFPTVNAMVFKWFTDERESITLYTGASLVFVTTGPDAVHRATAHYRLEGMGLRNPLAGDLSTGDTI